MLSRFIAFMTVAVVITLSACSQESPQQKANISIPLQEAVLAGDLATVRQHIEAGTNLNEVSAQANGSTPLVLAIAFGQKDMAIALINAGADLEIANNDGSTPLHVAAFFCHVDIVKALLAKNANREARNKMGATPYETVAAPFESVKPIYEMVEKMLAPMGVQLDFDHLRTTRPVVAGMLKE